MSVCAYGSWLWLTCQIALGAHELGAAVLQERIKELSTMGSEWGVTRESYQQIHDENVLARAIQVSRPAGGAINSGGLSEFEVNDKRAMLQVSDGIERSTRPFRAPGSRRARPRSPRGAAILRLAAQSVYVPP